MALVPARNHTGDTGALVGSLAKILPPPERARAMGVYEAAAAMRDLGMLLSSLRRHGVEPAEAVPAIVPTLHALGSRCGMIPRDTVYHYCPWNPTGRRQRQFTDDPQEAALIDSVRIAGPGVEAAIDELSQAAGCQLDTLDFVEHCRQGARNVSSMVRAITFARSRVDVVFFARVLRPYFEPISLDGRSYLGPAAAHLPLGIVDHLVWGSDCDDATYRMFSEDGATYTVSAWKELHRNIDGQPSLVTLAIGAVQTASTANRVLVAGAVALYTILRVLLAFRGRHKVLADKAYDPKVRLHSIGSGGFSAEAVTRVLHVTRERASALKGTIKGRFGVSAHPPPSMAAELRGMPSS
jgi:hypothetical protein